MFCAITVNHVHFYSLNTNLLPIYHTRRPLGVFIKYLKCHRVLKNFRRVESKDLMKFETFQLFNKSFVTY